MSKFPLFSCSLPWQASRFALFSFVLLSFALLNFALLSFALPILALPRFGDKEGGSALEVGLTDKAKIERLITTDIFGKSSTIRFSNVSTNFLVKDSEFIPVIPEGVEYIEN